ncbi:hypothetical protein TIFTF001_030639 [Ficus carica]|uniref:Uncharacterized protein n=1 Tax=Ficus carica TaxID=3494 RepID=A0AA88DU84_FICCA|nr:hypothetical protein TIFTF001_030639 [Ficus carica]
MTYQMDFHHRLWCLRYTEVSLFLTRFASDVAGNGISELNFVKNKMSLLYVMISDLLIRHWRDEWITVNKPARHTAGESPPPSHGGEAVGRLSGVLESERTVTSRAGPWKGCPWVASLVVRGLPARGGGGLDDLQSVWHFGSRFEITIWATAAWSETMWVGWLEMQPPTRHRTRASPSLGTYFASYTGRCTHLVEYDGKCSGAAGTSRSIAREESIKDEQ